MQTSRAKRLAVGLGVCGQNSDDNNSITRSDIMGLCRDSYQY